MKTLHIGDFIELIYEDNSEKPFGGSVTYLGSDSPASAKGTQKRYIVGINTSYPDFNQTEETTLWASRIKRFRIIHKGFSK